MTKTRRHFRFLKRLVILIIELNLLVILLPVYLLFIIPLFVSRYYSKKNKTVFFAGLEHVINKTHERGEYFKNNNFKVKYYSFEFTGNRSNKVSDDDVEIGNNIFSIDVIKFIINLLKYRPVYIEMYYEGKCISQLFYTIFSRIFGSMTISILRGELYNFENKSKYRNKLRILSWKLSDYIFYREDYMPEYFPVLGIDTSKTFYDHNKVPVKSHSGYKKDKKRVLFLNGIKKWRNIDVFIDSAKYVIKSISNVKFIIVGCRNNSEYEYVLSLVKNAGLTEYFDIKYWTDNPQEYYEIASIFVLPADLIFCNFSLLEAMERGLPAIVSDVEDADRIIEHNVNGYLSEINSEKFASYIIKLLEDDKLRMKMGKKARKKIIKEYNDEDRMLPILNLLEKNYSDVIK